MRAPPLPLLLITGLAACSAREADAPERTASAGAALSATQQAKLLAADGQASDSFGTSVAIDGDTAIVGAYQNSGAAGAAYVFVRNGAAWSQQAKLVAADPAPGDCFGISVALSGDTALIGAYGKPNPGPTAGAAYVFVRSGAAWSQQAKLVPADNTAGDAFGISAALEGDTALLGAMWKNQTRGAAYVYVRSGVAWSQQAKLVAADGQPDDQLGNAVALSGDRALIGAFHAGPKAPGSGAAYSFERQGGVWSADSKLFPADGAGNDFFGYAVALAGTSALVGAPNNSQAAFNAGATYAFDRSTGSWVQQAKLVASNAAAFDNFGRAIAMNAGGAVIGAPLVQAFKGAAYLFTRAGGAWAQGLEMSAAAGVSDDRFGEYVALSGASALIGAWGDDAKAMNAGAAYVFKLEGVDGTACVAAAECASGFCESGTCCATACPGGACVGGVCSGGTGSGSGGAGGATSSTGTGGAGGATSSTGTGGSTSSTGTGGATSSTGTGGATSSTGTGGAGGSTGSGGMGGASSTTSTTSGEVSSSSSGGGAAPAGGCGCRSAKGSSAGASAAWLTALALGLGRRRGRRAPSAPARRCALTPSRAGTSAASG